MTTEFNQLISELGQLREEDFLDGPRGSNGIESLEKITTQIMAQPNPENAIPALFDVIERMPLADLGAPGPIVHTLERMKGWYEPVLADSIHRKPTTLTIWMVNRILNATSTPEARRHYLRLLESVLHHPLATEGTRDAAKNFIKHQAREA